MPSAFTVIVSVVQPEFAELPSPQNAGAPSENTAKLIAKSTGSTIPEISAVTAMAFAP